MGSCINPFIYATTIPGFKKIVKNSLIRYGCIKDEVSQFPQMEMTGNWTSKTKDKTKEELIKSADLINPDQK